MRYVLYPMNQAIPMSYIWYCRGCGRVNKSLCHTVLSNDLDARETWQFVSAKYFGSPPSSYGKG
jgi:hypothetical protein